MYFEIHSPTHYKTKYCSWVMGILIRILKFWGILIHILKFLAPLSAKRSGILSEVVEGRAMGMFLFTAALLTAL
jgi:hypothetical protein